MGKAKHRKNHKQKVAAFKQRNIEKKNQLAKFQKLWIQNMEKNQEIARKEFLLETIYLNKNELVKENEQGLWILNEDAIEVQNDILVWKSDGNPILAGLEDITQYSNWTIDLVNEILPQMQGRLKWRAEQEAQASAEVANAGIGIIPVENAEYELMEDPNYTEPSSEN